MLVIKAYKPGRDMSTKRCVNGFDIWNECRLSEGRERRCGLFT